jgi:hypothetical protein
MLVLESLKPAAAHRMQLKLLLQLGLYAAGSSSTVYCHAETAIHSIFGAYLASKLLLL